MTKLRVPLWIVYIKNGRLEAYDAFATKTPPKEAVGNIIGYVSFKKKQQAIDYCLDMGFDNSYKTDHLPMRPWNRGEILWLRHDQGHPWLYVAEKTNRSIDWVRIVGSISGTARQQLINMYLEVKDHEERTYGEFDRQPTVTKKQNKTRTRIQGTLERNPNKKVRTKRTKKSVSTYRTKGRKTDGGLSVGGNNSNSSNKQGIADKLRNSKDYKGE